MDVASQTMRTTLIIGAGTAGAVLAARLSEDGKERVVLVEAGPDYGPYLHGRWPGDLLDAARITRSHDWDDAHDRTVSIRARVVGGSSTHNACVVAWGAPRDYDEWTPWSFALLERHLAAAERMLGAAAIAKEALSPWHGAMLAGAEACGIPEISSINDLSAAVGAATLTTNIQQGVRWNVAFAYLDPARERRNLRILADAVVDHVVFAGDRAVGACAEGCFIEADRTILAAGAYGTPAILQRSGVGPSAVLADVGVPLLADLPVGDGLADHPGVSIEWAPARRLGDALGARSRPEGQCLIRARSRHCSPDTWDLHLFPRLATDSAGEPRPSATIYALKPASTGSVRIASRDPTERLRISSGFLGCRDDRDCLTDGLALARRIAAVEPVASLVANEIRPGGVCTADYLREHVSSFFHPTGTCALGAVVDGNAAVIGLDQLYVADASIMPTLPRANTNLSVAGVAEYLATVLSAV